MVGRAGDVRVPDACPAFPHPVRKFAASAQPMAMLNDVVVMEGVCLIALGSFGHVRVRSGCLWQSESKSRAMRGL